MRQSYPRTSLGDLYVLLGVTRQVYNDSIKHAEKTTITNMVILTLVWEIRQQMPLLYVVEPKLIEH